jgi:hypothetical protein
MKMATRALALFVAVCLGSLAQQRPAPTLGALEGVVRDEQGVARPATVTVIRYRTNQSVNTGPDGAFRFADLPVGKYLICSRSSVEAGAKEDPFLDSCAGLDDSDTQQVTVAPVAAKQAPATVVLRRGARVRVRIADTGKHLAAQGAKSKGEGLFVSIAGPSGISYPVPVIGEDADGRDQEVVIPFEKAYKVNVRSTVFVLSDAKKQTVADNSAVDVRAVRGNGNPPVLVFNVERTK